MTEFLKGYAAGANDMEAGRLVPSGKPLPPLPESAYPEGATPLEMFKDEERSHAETIEHAEALIDKLRASALTAEEAKAGLLAVGSLLDAAERLGPDKAPMEPLRSLQAKLSLIANGEQSGRRAGW